MARLSVFSHELVCEPRAKGYFPRGVRETLLVGVRLADHSWGMGEYAPLTGIHAMGIAEAKLMAASIESEDIERYFAFEDIRLEQEFFPYPWSFIISLAYWHRAILSRPFDLDQRFLKLSGFIAAPAIKDALKAAKHYLSQGYTCLKIKVGALSIADEIEKIIRINALFAGCVELRLDANKRFSLDEAVQLARGLRGVTIRYIEEPCANIHELSHLIDECGIDVAVDESLLPGQSLTLLCELKARFIIIKPSRFMSITEVISLCNEARRLEIIPILSTCFESSFFSSLMALLAYDLGLLDNAHGIFFPNFFSNGFATKPCYASQARLSLAEAHRIVLDESGELRAFMKDL